VTRLLGALGLVAAILNCRDGAGPRPDSTSVGAGEPFWKATSFFGSSRPAIDSTSVFVADTGHVLWAIDRANGAVRWHVSIGGTAETHPRDALVSHGTVVVGDQQLYAFNARDGSPRWTFTNSTIPGTLYLGGDDSTVYAGAYVGSSAELFAIRFSDGSQRWKTVVVPDSILTTGEPLRLYGPVYSGGVVFVAFNWQRMDLRKNVGGIAAIDASTGTLLWSRTLPRPVDEKSTLPSNPAALNGVVVVSTLDGNVYALNSADGVVRWSAPPVVLGDGSSPFQDGRVVGIGSDVVVAGSGLGVITAFAATDGRRLWQTDPRLGALVEHVTVASYAVFSNHFTGPIASVDRSSGGINWRFDTSHQINVGFVESRLSGDTLYATGWGGLWALRAR